MFRAKLVPELLVADLAASLRFWRDLLGFAVAYDRPEEGFAYLDLDGAQVMLEQHEPGARQWLTGALDRPLGRGINFQTDVGAVGPILERLARAAWPLFMACEEKWYRADDVEVGQRQFLVQDPDGYLIRVAEDLGERKLVRSAVAATPISTNDPAEAPIDIYCGAWNEPDPARREELLAPVWAANATYTDPTVHTTGLAALVAHIGTVQAGRPGSRVVRTSAVDQHHGLVRFAWRRILADGTALPEGVDFGELGDDGKLRRIVGFFGPPAR